MLIFQYSRIKSRKLCGRKRASSKLPLQSAKIAAQLPITFNKNENGRLFFIFNAQYEMSLPGTARKKKKRKKKGKRERKEREPLHTAD